MIQQMELESKVRPGFALVFCSCVSLTKSRDPSGPQCFQPYMGGLDSAGHKVSLPPSFLILFPMDYSGLQILCSSPYAATEGLGRSGRAYPLHLPSPSTSPSG